jgi:ribose/xylose/arabinose/galactoside ABC-type transport system permease subunit
LFLKLYFLISIFNKIIMHVFEIHPFIFTLFLCLHSLLHFSFHMLTNLEGGWCK